MAFLSRMVQRQKWEPTQDLGLNEIAADAVTADLRTTGNTLSFWRGDNDSTAVEQVALALATSRDKLDRIDIAWMPENLFEEDKLTLEASDGNTPVETMRSRHMDIIRLDVSRLGAVAVIIQQGVRNRQCRRFTKAQVSKLIKEALENNLLRLEALPPGIQQGIAPQPSASDKA
jgi:hypothetical protein